MCGPFCPDTATVPDFDLVPYMGRWYEVGTSSIPRDTFERGLVCNAAFYTLFDIVQVNNSGLVGSPTGPNTFIVGKADVPDASVPGALEVTFTNSFTGNPNYFVMAVDYDSYVLIGGPCQLYLWILSRTPSISDSDYDYLISIAEKEGYNPDRIGFKREDNSACRYQF